MSQTFTFRHQIFSSAVTEIFRDGFDLGFLAHGTPLVHEDAKNLRLYMGLEDDVDAWIPEMTREEIEASDRGCCHWLERAPGPLPLFLGSGPVVTRSGECLERRGVWSRPENRKRRPECREKCPSWVRWQGM